MAVPELQWAQVNEGGRLHFKQIPVPKPGKGEVLVNILYSGVCHTDFHALNGDWPFPPNDPLIGGHEGAGVVVSKGELTEGIEIGDKVGVKVGSCLMKHACEFCEEGNDILCPTAKFSGYTTNGTFQQYCLAQAATVARIPDGCNMAAVAPILCAGITVYKGLKTSECKPGQTVAIVGAGGGLGSLAQQYAKAMGLRVIAIDGGEEKGKMSLEELGADTYIDFLKSKDIVNDVKNATADGLGPHGVILVSTSPKPFEQASEYVRPNGTVVPIGLPPDGNIKASVFWGVLKMLRIKCSYVGTRRDTAEALDFFARGLIKAPYKLIGLSQLQEVYSLMEKGQILGRYVLDMSK
ncbi:uncharacterized protein Z519_05296 [Cladophialophora bantiana CBS 173.52]|uniref:alcohol dehydrogenase n=1 Tax=Cladophialophora bantiana (strain ATCC 10958 / CBS 173.52 / CDC B-1940 / NIH 8579) TaxID=1442370 RepID=A0A0D2EVY6_CLAB1|nr:uncharacterized protein Z519_05296 [Cladophialophora bantiana CBS 173.52]KIW93981.1 hypothetical protein Z519_05296 [Cladophialophora bantiana CBS 173.52]